MLPAGMALAGGYLIGSIPFGWLVARAHGINIQEAGSGASASRTRCLKVSAMGEILAKLNHSEL